MMVRMKHPEKKTQGQIYQIPLPNSRSLSHILFPKNYLSNNSAVLKVQKPSFAPSVCFAMASKRKYLKIAVDEMEDLCGTTTAGSEADADFRDYLLYKINKIRAGPV